MSKNVYRLLLPTCQLASLWSLTSVVPLVLQCGWSPNRWRRILFQQQYNTEIERYCAALTISSTAGLYLGALPIPLDWDRPWQVLF